MSAGSATASNTEVVVEQCGVFRFEWGGGGTIPELPAAVHRLVSCCCLPCPLSLGDLFYVALASMTVDSVLP